MEIDKTIIKGSPTNESNQHWIAFHDDPAERRRVVWKAITYIENGNRKTKNHWVDSDNDSKVWNGQLWIDFQLVTQ